jgi:hypothetical protein
VTQVSYEGNELFEVGRSGLKRIALAAAKKKEPSYRNFCRLLHPNFGEFEVERSSGDLTLSSTGSSKGLKLKLDDNIPPFGAARIIWTSQNTIVFAGDKGLHLLKQGSLTSFQGEKGPSEQGKFLFRGLDRKKETFYFSKQGEKGSKSAARFYAVDASGKIDEVSLAALPVTISRDGVSDSIQEGNSLLEPHPSGSLWIERNGKSQKVVRAHTLPNGLTYDFSPAFERQTPFYSSSVGPIVFLKRDKEPGSSLPALFRWPASLP